MDRSTTSAAHCATAVRTAGSAALDLLLPAAAGDRGEPAPDAPARRAVPEMPVLRSRKMAVELEINRKRAQRLMRILGIEAHYPKPNLSRPAPGHQIYPYLLRGIAIEGPN